MPLISTNAAGKISCWREQGLLSQPRGGIHVQAFGAVSFSDLLEVVTRFFFFPKRKTGGICALKYVELAVGCREIVHETH